MSPRLSEEEKAASASARERARPHVAEWFGHRVYPQVASHQRAREDQRSGRCPFLSQIEDRSIPCVKAPNSRGVCTVSASSNGTRQDWLVCPERVLDARLLDRMIRRLFDVPTHDPVSIYPAHALDQPDTAGLRASLAANSNARHFLSFQKRFGGEISLPQSSASPRFSFDVTVVEMTFSPESQKVSLGRYGVIEIQTTDTHGSYAHAVSALDNALDLHQEDFAEQVSLHPEWPGRRVEGPNISNVFKRTFYQLMFKFQLANRSSSAGCILALPRPVWDSWQPFLGAPSLVHVGEGVHQLVDSNNPSAEPVSSPNWIYVLDIAEEPPPDGGTTPVEIDLVIATDAPTLSRLALETAPAHAIGDGESEDSVLAALQRRIGQRLPLVQPSSPSE